MLKTGVAKLPLHYGKAPRWLVVRMQRLAKEIVTIIIDKHGSGELFKRLSDPFWFQALGCVLGYDWHSSGVTTVVTSVLKKAIIPKEHGVAVCGGKGRFSRQTPLEIQDLGEKFDFSESQMRGLCYASRMSAKVDNTAIQAGYPLYHHAFFVDKDGKWAVVQQGMCLQDRTARRYHWLSENVKNFAVEPHNAIVGDVKREAVLDMTARESDGCRKVSVDLVCESPKKVMRLLLSIRPAYQKSLESWLSASTQNHWFKYSVDVLSMPSSVNWKALQQVYEFKPRNYEELLSFKGVGAATVRGLALIAELIYGEKPSWKDPVKYSFAYGGKDGVPFPVDRKAMDESTQFLKMAVEESKLGNVEKMKALERLRAFVPKDSR